MAQNQNNIAVCGVRFVYYLYEPVLYNLLNRRHAHRQRNIDKRFDEVIAEIRKRQTKQSAGA